jgi:hypothetical protein
MAQSVVLLLFGDQTFDIPSSLHLLASHRRDSKSLNKFLHNTEQLLRREIAKFPPGEQAWFPHHVSIQKLGDHYADGSGPQTSLQTFLACVVQLGNLILYVMSAKGEFISINPLLRVVENDPELLNIERRSQVVGVCTGSISAAAACISRSLPDLLEVSTDVASISLYLGVAMQRRAEILEKTDASWAFIASNVDGNALDQILFHYNKVSLWCESDVFSLDSHPL